MTNFKVYDDNNQMIAETPNAEVAAVVVGTMTERGRVEYGRKGNVVWKEGINGNAANSFDAFAMYALQVIESAEDFHSRNPKMPWATCYTAARGVASLDDNYRALALTPWGRND